MTKHLIPAYASLTTSGWIRGLLPQGARLLKNYLTTNYSQSNIESGGMVSLAYDIQQASNRPRMIEDRVRVALNSVFTRYFDFTEVSAKVEDTEDESQLILVIKIRFGRSGYVADLSNTIVADRNGTGNFTITE